MANALESDSHIHPLVRYSELDRDTVRFADIRNLRAMLITQGLPYRIAKMLNDALIRAHWQVKPIISNWSMV